MKKFVCGFEDYRIAETFFDYGVYIARNGIGTVYICSDESDMDYNEVGIDYKCTSRILRGLDLLHDNTDPRNHIKVVLNTPGGNFYHGMCIYDRIKELTEDKRKVLIVGYGMVMSMGALIMQAGTERVMSPFSTMMVHCGTTTLSGESLTVIKQAEEEKRLNVVYENIIHGRIVEKKENSGFEIDDVRKLLDRDTYLSAQEAKNLGLIDYVIGTKKTKGNV